MAGIGNTGLVGLPKSELDNIAWPSGFASVVLGLNPYPWQAENLDAMLPDQGWVSGVTCNESGKTSMMMLALGLWHMAIFPGSICVSTSATNKQIANQLWPNITPRIGHGFFRDWKIADSVNHREVKAPNGSQWVAYSTSDGGSFEGYHARGPDSPLLMMLDEAKSIDEEIWQAVQRCHPQRLFVASSPGALAGFFYDIHNKPAVRQDFKTFKVSWNDCPHLYDNPGMRKQIEGIIRRYGVDSAFVRSTVFGEFAQSGGDMLFDMERVRYAMSGLVRRWGSDRAGAVDLSGGGDEQVFYVRHGNEAALRWCDRETDATVLASKLKRQFELSGLKPWEIRVDAGHLGNAICDMLARVGWDVVRVNFGGSSRNPEEYANPRAEMYANLAQLIRMGMVRLASDETVIEQLGWVRMDLGALPQIKLTRKDKYPGSPDRADTLAMLYLDMPTHDMPYEMDERELRNRLGPTLGAGRILNGPPEPEGALLF